jgi:hypothetical protein
MRIYVLLAPVIASALAAWPALAAADPVDRCRAAHAAAPAEHIACLEAALRASDAAPPEAGQPAGLGAEQVISSQRLRDEAAAAPVNVRILSATYNVQGLGTFHMEDGQVWRETAPAPARRRLKPDTPYSARIVPGSLGGYRMHVEGVRWMKTVQRLE